MGLRGMPALWGTSEVGWRGYVLPRLQSRHSAPLAAVLVGPFWMFWHALTFVFEEAFSELSLVRAFGWALLLVAGSVMLTWLYNGTGGSLLIPILFHGTQDLTLASIAARGEALNAGWAALFLALTVAIVLWAGPAGLSRSGKCQHTAPSRSPGNHGKSGGQR
jgi:membrane protease YdiL (CAAX protease family)